VKSRRPGACAWPGVFFPRAVAGALVAVLMVAVAPVWAAQWYELYERGLGAEAQGAWAEALGLFEEAERFRSEPEERVRTYGNRFLFSYDPAFHRARCLAELGRLDEARAALAASAAAGVTAEAEIAALRQRLTRLETQFEAQHAPRTEPSDEAPPEDREEPAAGAVPALVAPGHFDIHTTPSGVRFEIDGRRGGTTPVEEVEVPAGTHRVRLVDERPGSDLLPWEQEVEVLPGERVHLDVTLARRPSQEGGEPPDGETRRRRDGQAEEPAGSVVDGAGADLGPTTAELEPAEADSGPATEGLDRLQEPASAELEPSAPPPSREGAAPSPPDASSGVPADGSPLRALWGWPLGAALGAGLLVVLIAGFAAVRRRSRRRGGRVGPRATGAIDRRLGERIGRYRIEEVLGRGGMATTYRARRLDDRTEVALKIPHETGDPSYAERFVREGRLGETLHHPGIVRILEAGQDDGQAFLAMELLPGHTLRELMDSAESPLLVERCLAIVREIAEALDYAHSKGVVHRDLKPENVMVLPDGALRVMDFGVARVEGQPGLTNSQFFFGSPVYAAPELVDPRTIDHRADLYSLGVLLYELLEGEPPFVHESIFKLLEMHQREPLPRPEGLPRPLPPAVWRVIVRMLAKEREARYASAQELLVELKRLLYAVSDGSPPVATGGG